MASAFHRPLTVEAVHSRKVAAEDVAIVRLRRIAVEGDEAALAVAETDRRKLLSS